MFGPASTAASVFDLNTLYTVRVLTCAHKLLTNKTLKALLLHKGTVYLYYTFFNLSNFPTGINKVISIPLPISF